MRKRTTLVVASALAALAVLIACEFEVPLETAHEIAIDPALLGLWEPAEEKDREPGNDQRILILRFSDTEYLIRFPVWTTGKFWRGYPIRVEGIDCVQLEAIGTEEGPLPPKTRRRFLVATYRLGDDGLTVRLLNGDVVDFDAKTTDALRDDFRKHKDDPKLFGVPERFRCVPRGDWD